MNAGSCISESIFLTTLQWEIPRVSNSLSIKTRIGKYEVGVEKNIGLSRV